MVGDGVYPLVERGVELGDYVLLPLLADEAEERLDLLIEYCVPRPRRCQPWPRRHSVPARETAAREARANKGEGVEKKKTKERKRTIVRMANARI